MGCGLVLIALLLVGHVVLAGQWNCAELASPIDSGEAQKIRAAFDGASYEEVDRRLNGLLDDASGRSKAYVYLAIAMAGRVFGKLERAEDFYRRVYDFEDANINIRERARSALSLLLSDRGKAQEIIDLYNNPERPVCGQKSAEATYALALAYNAIGNDIQARQVFEQGETAALEVIKHDAELRTKWQVLNLRLDCVQQRWSQCAEGFDKLVRLEHRGEPLTKQLTAFLLKLRAQPELHDILQRLQGDGLVSENDVLPAQISNSSKSTGCCCADPAMPADAKSLGLTGSVIVLVGVDEVGNLRRLEIVESKPARIFDNVVINALIACHFKPKIVDGKPAPAQAKRQYNFGVAKPNPG